MQLIGLIIMAVIAAFVLLFVFLPVVAWSILGLTALLILILLLIPLGAEMTYTGGEFSLSAKVSAFTLKLFPKQRKAADGEEAERAKRKKKEKTPAANADAKPKKKLNLSFEEILELVKKAMKGLGKFGRLTVHKFVLHYVAAGKDPYSTAMNYSYANAALSALAPVCANAFNVKGDVDVRTDVDFLGEEMFFEAELSITLRLIQLLRVALVFGFGALWVLIKNRCRLRREKRLAEKTNINTVNTTEETKEANTETEERMDSNG